MLKWLKSKAKCDGCLAVVIECLLWLVLIVVAVLVVMLFFGCTINFGIFKTISTPDKNFDILRNTALGIGGILALIYTARRLKQTDAQIEQNKESTLSNTYKNAVEMLANQSASVQIAGIDILQQIAQENPEYKAKIIKLLSQHVVVKSKENFWQLVKRFKEKSKDDNGNIANEKDFNESDFTSLQNLKEYANSINWYMYLEIQKAVDALFTIAVVDKATLDIIHGTDKNKAQEAYHQLPVIDLRGARFAGEIYFNLPYNNNNVGYTDKAFYYKWNITNVVFLDETNVFGLLDARFLVDGSSMACNNDVNKYNTFFINSLNNYNTSQYYTECYFTENINIKKYSLLHCMDQINFRGDNKSNTGLPNQEEWVCFFSEGLLYMVRKTSLLQTDATECNVFYGKKNDYRKWRNYKILERCDEGDKEKEAYLVSYRKPKRRLSLNKTLSELIKKEIDR